MPLSKLNPVLFTLIIILAVFNIKAQSSVELFQVKKADLEESRFFVAKAIQYELRSEELKVFSSSTEEKVEIRIPTFKGDKILEVERFEVLSQRYQLQTQQGYINSEAGNYQFFRGKVIGSEQSKVGISIIDGVIHMLIHDVEGSFEIKQLKSTKGQYIGFYTHDLKENKFIPCETETNQIGKVVEEEQISVQRNGPLECVEIYLEIDYAAYVKKNSSVSETEEWALAILAQVAIFYIDAGIPITVSGIKIYTSSASDPYSGMSNTSEALTTFRDSLNNQGFTGRLAHLMSGKNLGGGRAYLNVLCSNTLNYGVSGNLSSGGTSYSTYTWNINVIAHELGHNFGSNHTHDCVWNGNNTQIDDCGNVWLTNNNYSTGSCYDDQNVIIPGNNGTIMSYCHAIGSQSKVNLNLGFHQQVRDLIYSRYTSTNCSGEEACIGVPPLNDVCERAYSLTPTFTCNPITFDNEISTDSGTTPSFQCGNSTAVKDVWFVVQVPSNGILTIETSEISGGLADLVLQVYSGSCNSLIAEYCDDDSGAASQAKVEIDNINLANQDILIRVIEKNDVEGDFSICTYSTQLPCSDAKDELIDFYTSMNGSAWTNNTGWADGAAGNDCNFCEWYGIDCDVNGDIISISLSDNNLSGILGTALLNFDQLENLDLSYNQITGSLDAIFVNPLNLLSLNLSNNVLQGSISEYIVTAPKLENLIASENQLSGTLPAFSYSSKLNYLDLSENIFEGCFPSTYSRFFSTGEINLINNPNLPFNGDFYGFALDYSGFDFDKDGFCFNIDDCVDFDNTIYDGAPELCDGLDNNCDGDIDENHQNIVNEWVGPSTNGKWNVPANWSLGHVPLACEDVEIGMEGSSYVIEETGAQSSLEQYLKSICVGPNVELDITNTFYLYVKNGYILNMGTLNINSYSTFSNLDPNRNGIENHGTLNIKEGTYVYLSNSGRNGFYNDVGGVFNNMGTLVIDSNNPITGKAGLTNSHIITNEGVIQLIGTFSDEELELKTGSILINNGRIEVGGESFEGGN